MRNIGYFMEKCFNNEKHFLLFSFPNKTIIMRKSFQEEFRFVWL